jgi:hypothetical protein
MFITRGDFFSESLRAFINADAFLRENFQPFRFVV